MVTVRVIARMVMLEALMRYLFACSSLQGWGYACLLPTTLSEDGWAIPLFRLTYWG